MNKTVNITEWYLLQCSQDPSLFVKHHSKAFENSGTTLRTLYYPALVDVSPKEQQVRCGEHSDYGGITLLFQERPGLEVNQSTHSLILYNFKIICSIWKEIIWFWQSIRYKLVAVFFFPKWSLSFALSTSCLCQVFNLGILYFTCLYIWEVK